MVLKCGTSIFDSCGYLDPVILNGKISETTNPMENTTPGLETGGTSISAPNGQPLDAKYIE